MYLEDFDISRDHNSDLPDCLKDDKFKALADAVNMYLNGDYKSVLGQQDENDIMDEFNTFKDVDEWELEAGNNDIMAKLEENIMKQENMHEKEVIVDDIDDLDTITDQPLHLSHLRNNRVTTVMEEQTQEDQESDSDDDGYHYKHRRLSVVL